MNVHFVNVCECGGGGRHRHTVAKENETDHDLHGIHRATTMLLEEMMA